MGNVVALVQGLTVGVCPRDGSRFFDQRRLFLVVHAKCVDAACGHFLPDDIVQVSFEPALPSLILPFAGGIQVIQRDPVQPIVRKPAEPGLMGGLPQFQLFNQEL